MKKCFTVSFAIFLILWGYSAYIPNAIQNLAGRPVQSVENRSEQRGVVFASILPSFVGLKNPQKATTPEILNRSLSFQKDSQVQQIDQQIQELEEMKRGFESRALRHEDQANRLQFDDQTYLETRRHIQLAEENRAKANAVQKEIDRLQAEKEKLLRDSR